MKNKNKNKNKSIKIGILGGTFDPPHVGHVHISKIALKKLKLNYIIWLITKKNPLKEKPYLSTSVRIMLVRDLIKKQKKISVKYLDNLIKSNNTFDLLNYIKKKNNRVKLFFLIGADNLINFHRWKKWSQIPNLAKIVVFARANYSSKAVNSIAAKKLSKNDLLYINSKKMNISSSLIRKL